METKRKKTLFNVIMVVLILIIAGCGIMAVGNLKGWGYPGNQERNNGRSFGGRREYPLTECQHRAGSSICKKRRCTG